MSRTIIEVPMKTHNVDLVLSIIDKIARSYGFNPKTIDGETVWGKGDGVVVKMQFISAAFTDHSVLLSGWTRDIVTGESDLEGFAAIIPKRKMKKMISDIQQTIIQNQI